MSNVWLLQIEQQWTQMSKYLCSKMLSLSYFQIFALYLECFACMTACASCVCSTYRGYRRHRFSNSSHRWWVLGIKSRSSGRAPSAHNPRAISPDLFVLSWVLMLNHSNDKCPAFCPKCLACLGNSDHLSVVGLEICCLLSYLFTPSCPLRQQ